MTMTVMLSYTEILPRFQISVNMVAMTENILVFCLFFLIVISLCTNAAVDTCCDQKFSVKWEILLTSQKMDSVIQVGKYSPIH